MEDDVNCWDDMLWLLLAFLMDLFVGKLLDFYHEWTLMD